MMIERIRREHGYMARLLMILKTKLELLQKERAINYSLVAEVGWLGEPTTRVNNIRSHFFGSINGRTRCLSCDIGGYEADKERCPKKEQRDIDFAKVDAIKAEKESV